MISIITAIRNQLPMNRLYFEFLKKYTIQPFELIIIDNASTDGSVEFFREQGAIVISNKSNYSYPHCQNQGIAVASFDVLAFFNNDLLVAPGWDVAMMDMMAKLQVEVVSFASNDRVENVPATYRLRNKWKWIKVPMQFLFGAGYANLKRMHRMMYGNWEKWSASRKTNFHNVLTEGFSGSCIACTRNALHKTGSWDERIMDADFDFYLRTKKRNIEAGDIQPIHMLQEIFFHHYGRLTARSKDYLPFADEANIISLTEKWGAEMDNLLKDIHR